VNRSAATAGIVGTVAAGLLALSLSSTPARHSVSLPVVRAASQTVPDRLVIPVPDGITPHLTNTELAASGDGSLFVRTQAQSPIREYVWQVRDGEIVSEWDAPPECHGNGSLSVVGGDLFLLCVSEERRLALLRVPGWVRP
jgi:hypothetical protein